MLHRGKILRNAHQLLFRVCRLLLHRVDLLLQGGIPLFQFRQALLDSDKRLAVRRHIAADRRLFLPDTGQILLHAGHILPDRLQLSVHHRFNRLQKRSFRHDVPFTKRSRSCGATSTCAPIFPALKMMLEKASQLLSTTVRYSFFIPIAEQPPRM